MTEGVTHETTGSGVCTLDKEASGPSLTTLNKSNARFSTVESEEAARAFTFDEGVKCGDL